MDLGRGHRSRVVSQLRGNISMESCRVRRVRTSRAGDGECRHPEVEQTWRAPGTERKLGHTGLWGPVREFGYLLGGVGSHCREGTV